MRFVLVILYSFFFVQGFSQTTSGNNIDTSELFSLQSQLKEFSALNNRDSQARYLGAIAYYYYSELKDLPKALEFYNKAITTAEDIKDTPMIALYLFSKGVIYKNQGIHDNALKDLLSATAYFEMLYAHNADTVTETDLASCYNSIGDMYRILGQHKLALKYYRTCLDMWRKRNNPRYISSSLNFIGEFYSDIGQYDSALFYLQRSLQIKEQLKDSSLILSTLLNIGSVYLREGNFSIAEKYFKKVAQPQNIKYNKIAFGIACNELARVYYKQKKYHQALNSAEVGYEVLQEQKLNRELINNYDLRRNIYKELNEFSNALYYDSLYISLKDVLFNEQKNRALAEMEVKYETDKKEQQLILLTEQKQTQRLRIISLLGFIILMGLIILIIAFSYRREKNDKQQIKSLMLELNHRVKNNLQLLKGLVSMQYDRLSDVPAKEAVKEIENRINSIAHIHRALYEVSTISSINLKEYLNDIVNDLVSAYGFEDKLKLITSMEDIKVTTDRAIALGLIVNEIVSNAFKHAYDGIEKPVLSMRLSEHNAKSFILQISDNGKGQSGAEPVEKKESFGLKIIQLLSQQIKAEVHVTYTNGLMYELIVEK